MATELARLLQVSAIIDLTPGSGHWAMHAVRCQIPYVGCCFTPTHVDMLYAKLRSRILSAAMDANDTDLYNAQLSTLVTSKCGEATATGQDGSKDEGKTPEGAKPSGTALPNAATQALLDRIASIKGQATASGSGADEDINDG